MWRCPSLRLTRATGGILAGKTTSLAWHYNFDVGPRHVVPDRNHTPLLHTIADPLCHAKDRSFPELRVSNQKDLLVFQDYRDADCVPVILEGPEVWTILPQFGRRASLTAALLPALPRQ